MIFNRVIDELSKKRQRRLDGKVNSIPFPFKRFSTVLPGIEQGRYYNVTANSKVGKTQLADFLFLYSPVIYWMNKGKEEGIDVKIHYFSLEMSKEEKMKQLIAHYLYTKNNLLLSPTKLESKFENYILDEKILTFLSNEKEFFEIFEEKVTFYDEIRNPYGIYRAIREYAYENGEYYDKENNILDKSEIQKSNPEVTFKINYYKPNNPDEYVIIIIDHVSLITPEKGFSKHESMSKLSSDYLLHMRDRWNYIPVVVQQQSAEVEKQQFTMGGSSIINKIKPSPDGLADNKLIGRDCNYMLGLFAPNRYEFQEFNGYNLTKLRDNHRDLSIIFSRHSSGSQSVGLLFLGAVNYFEELPKVMTEENYNKVIELQEKMK